ncbi:MAG: ankyrin repeat domain-containing protein [Desulfobacterales bacterium]|nr:ankyrin repeat domain-containing protein [Desulfobacterales bacterium]
MKNKRVLHILFSLFLFSLIPLIGHAGDEELNNSLIQEVKAGNFEMVKYWLDQGADPNAKVQSGLEAGRSALFLAVNEGHVECVKILLSAGADVNTRDFYGKTPLDEAKIEGHKEIVQILKEAGAEE